MKYGFLIKTLYRCLIRLEDPLLVHQVLQGFPSARRQVSNT
jgi:hypothetical protein